MRDLDALLNSLVNIDRKSLIAILSSEAEAARQFVSAARQRTASQRAKRYEAERRAVLQRTAGVACPAAVWFPAGPARFCRCGSAVRRWPAVGPVRLARDPDPVVPGDGRAGPEMPV
jgi:hypothetical protein